MGLFNPRNVVDLLLSDYKDLDGSPIQEDEIRMKDTLKGKSLRSVGFDCL